MSQAGLRNWVFTAYDLEHFQVPDTDKNFRYCIYQAETCPTTSRVHLQGYAEFTRTMRMKKIKELFHDPTMHLEPRQGSREQARAYCKKAETRYAEPIEFGTWDVEPGKRLDLVASREKILGKRKLEECFQDAELDSVTTKYPRWVERVHASKKVDYTFELDLKDWQRDLYGLLEQEVQHRRIFWIWSTKSATGKTTFMEWISLKMDVLPAQGKLQDILYAYDSNQIIWFDMTRAQAGYESYSALETLSNVGFKLSTKYQTTKKFVRAHIVVTSNHAPDKTKLPDRFYEINVD